MASGSTTKSASSQRRSRVRRLEMEPLEGRQMLATVAAGGAVTYTEDASPVILAPWARIGTLRSGSRDLAVNIAGGGGVMDQLSITASSRVRVSGHHVLYDDVAIGYLSTSRGSLTVSFWGNATRESMQAVLRRVSFRALGDTPTTERRTVVYELREASPATYIRYSTNQWLLVRKPNDWQATDRRPAIILFHGGGWTGGSPGQFEHQATYYASQGMVAIAASYRFASPDGTTPPWNAIQDAKSAIRWVREHAAELGVDPQRIAAGGGSAGGHLAATAGMVLGYDNPDDNLSVSSRPDALVLFSAVIDDGPTGFAFQRFADVYEDLSPAHNVSPDDPPVLFLHGGQDRLLPADVVDRFHASLDEAGVPATFHRYPAGHTFYQLGQANSRYFTQTLRRSTEFFQNLGWLSGPRGMDVPQAYRFETRDFAAIGENFTNVTVRAVNDAPQLRLGGSIGYVRDSPGVRLAPSAMLKDVDSLNMAGGQLRIRVMDHVSYANRLYASGEFHVDPSNNVFWNSNLIGTLNPWGGIGKTHYVVTFNTSATPSIVRRLIQSIKFGAAGGEAGTRRIEFSVTDGDGGLSATQLKTVFVS